MHVAAVLWSDLMLGDVRAEGAQNVQLFFVIICQLLRDVTPCADGEIVPLHESEAPGGTPSKVVDLHVTCYRYCHEANGVCGDASTCRRVLHHPLSKFILQLWPFRFVPPETLPGRLRSAQVVFLLPPPAHHCFSNVEFSGRGSIPVDDCVADGREFETRLVRASSLNRCHFGVLGNTPQHCVEAQHVLLREAPDYGGPKGPTFRQATRRRGLSKYH